MPNIPRFFEAQWQDGQPIPIKEEIALMEEEALLEVTIPVDTLVDLLTTRDRFSGFLSQVNMPPEFVMTTDLMGNRYELIINQENNIELPEEGIGRFSIPKACTFIFNSQQVQALPQPIVTLGAPGSIISVSHLNDQGVKIIDSVRHIKSKEKALSEKNKIRAIIAEEMYPFSRFMEDYMKGDRFGLSQERGYNNFELWGLSSSLEALYDLLIKGLANRKISGEFIFNRVEYDLFHKYGAFFLNRQTAYASHLKGSLSIDALLDTSSPILPIYQKNTRQEKSPEKDPPSSRPRRG